jgi:3-hydroxyisobutyrate dehydrogenase
MIAGDFRASFTLGGAVKDSGLIADALRGLGLDASLMAALREQFARAADAGHAEDDMAAVITAIAGQDRAGSG